MTVTGIFPFTTPIMNRSYMQAIWRNCMILKSKELRLKQQGLVA